MTSHSGAPARPQGMEPFEEVVRRHGATVLRVCRAVLGERDAEDAWSETFLSALRAYPGLDPGTDLRGWLVTVAHRRAVDQLRARRADPVAEPVTAPTADRYPSDDDALYAAMGRLTERQRLAVAHHHLAGLPHGEVAALLGCSPDAARRSCADGIARLRTLLGENDD